jgi:hypothetical protein
MWQLHGRLSNTVGAQLNAIMDPLTTPRTSSAIKDKAGNLIQIPDERPLCSGSTMHSTKPAPGY